MFRLPVSNKIKCTHAMSHKLLWRSSSQYKAYFLRYPFKYEAQTALFKDPVRTAQ